MMVIIKGPFATIDHVTDYKSLLVTGAEFKFQTSAYTTVACENRCHFQLSFHKSWKRHLHRLHMPYIYIQYTMLRFCDSLNSWEMNYRGDKVVPSKF